MLKGCRLLVHYGETRPSRFVWAGPLTPDISLEKLNQTFSAYGAVRNIAFIPGTRHNSCELNNISCNGLTQCGPPPYSERLRGGGVPDLAGGGAGQEAPQRPHDRELLSQGGLWRGTCLPSLFTRDSIDDTHPGMPDLALDFKRNIMHTSDYMNVHASSIYGLRMWVLPGWWLTRATACL
jgi:hypothetical protein